MATASLSDFANVTREAFRKNVEFLGNKSYWLDKNFAVGAQAHQGESLIWQPFQTRLPESATFSAENAADPTPVAPVFDKGKVYIKKLLAKMLYSEETVQLNRGDEAIIKDLLNLRNGTMAAYNLVKEFSVHTPGSGVLFQSTENYGDQTFIVDDIRWARPGMVVDGFNSDSIVATAIVITNVDIPTKVVTFTGTVTGVTTATKFYYAGTRTTGTALAIDTGRFTNGIETICSDADPAYGSFMGVDRDTYSYMKATVKYGASAGTAEAFTIKRFMDLCDLLDITVGPEYMPTLAYASNGVYNAIYQAFKAENQPTIFMSAKDGIPAGLTFDYGAHQIKIVKSRFGMPKSLLLPNLKHIFKYSGGVEGWQTMAGQVQQVSGYQQFSEVYRGWRNFGTDFPQSNGALFDITEA